MLRYGFSIAFAFVLATGITVKISASESEVSDEQAIAKIEQEWNEALKTKDRAVFEKYMSEDIVYVGSKGELVSDRAALIDSIVNGDKVASYSVSDRVIKVHGQTAVLTALWDATLVNGTKESTRYVAFLRKDPDGWKCVASHDTNRQ